MHLRIAYEKLKTISKKVNLPFDSEETTISSKENEGFNGYRTFVNTGVCQYDPSFSANNSILSDKQMDDELENLIRTFDI
jgi:hypothetical protein